MPRIRTIKPQFWDSPDTARASLRVRLLYIAMWNWADDWGVGDANPKRLLGFAFPNDDDVSVADFPRLSEELFRCYGVAFYEVAGRHYYAIPAWDEHQRTEKRAGRFFPGPEEANFPVITRELESPPPSDGDSAVESRKVAGGNKEIGNRKKEIGSVTDAARPDVLRLCNLLADLIEGNGSKRPTVSKAWMDAARLMLDADKRPLGEALAVMQWSQADSFWRSNILSMPKFRDKYDQLRLQRANPTTNKEPEPVVPRKVFRRNDAD